MNGKICLVTGGNAGIGKYTCIGLAKKGAYVIFVARNEAKAKKAREEIRKASGSNKVDYLVGDLSSQEQVRQIAKDFEDQYARLDVLINNAGAFYDKAIKSPEGFEMQWAVNHLAYFLLTHLLLPQLRKSPHARIVNVASNSHYRGKIVLDDLQFERRSYGGLKVYEQSKLANVLFTRRLSQKLAPEGITANSLHPGVVKTSIAQKHSGALYNFLWGVMKLFAVSEEKGAETSIYLASSPEVAEISGKYFSNKKVKRESKRAQDDEMAQKLWEVSEKQVQLSGAEMI